LRDRPIFSALGLEDFWRLRFDNVGGRGGLETGRRRGKREEGRDSELGRCPEHRCYEGVLPVDFNLAAVLLVR